MATYYLSPTGNDSNPGSINAPWLTWQKGFETIVAGDTLYIRGGTYASAGTLRGADYVAAYVNNHDGTPENKIVVSNYPGETPVLDCATMSGDAAHYGIVLINCSYWHLIGLEVMNVPQHATGDWAQGIAILYSTNITTEECVAHHNGGVGIGCAFATDDILILNCDSYSNADPYTISGAGAYGNADGFGMEESAVGTSVIVRGCRAWNNSDDGFDCWDSDGHVLLDNCWSWHNGYREDGVTQGGDGNGFKLGRSSDIQTVLARTITNCLAFLNRYSGFTTNNAMCLMNFYNSTSWNNGYVGFQITGPDIAYIFRNLISFDNLYNFNVIKPTNAIIDHNSYHNTWQPTGPVASSADFVSVDSTGVNGARQADGSLPILNFMRLANGSDLIDAGVNVGLSYVGTAPDLGAYEYFGIYYVAPNGSDTTGDGTIGNPWFTLEEAWNHIGAGDIVYMRGGTYEYLQTQTLAGVSGTLGNTIKIYNYPGEVPIIRKHASWVHVGWYYGVFFQSCSYIEVKGIRVTNFKYQQTSPCRGIMAQHVSNGLFENLACYDNELGMMLTGNSGNNLILNCDFYNNYDPFSPIPYGNSDGLDVSSIPNAYNNIVRGCRAWNNGDDGFDFWASEGIVTVQNCWAWSNGYREDGVTTGGDGNGFKLGQVNLVLATTRRYLYNCIAALNRVNNFSQNIVTPQVLTCELYNCLSYGAVAYSGYQFNWGAEAAQNSIMRNNISYADVYAARLSAFITNDHNSWNSGYSVSAADFVSLNHYQLSSARQADGSLPLILFGTLASGSSLIDAGIDVGLPFTGAAPDLGAFEFAGIPTVRKYETVIDYSIPTMPLSVTGIPSWLTVWNDDESVPVLEGETIMPATTLLLYPNSENTGSQRKGTIHIKDFIPVENDVALAVKQNGGPTMSTMEVVNAPGENNLIIEAYTTRNAYGSNLVVFSCTPVLSQFAIGVPLTLTIQVQRSGMVVYGSTPTLLVMNNRQSNGPFSINMTSASVLSDNIVILLSTLDY